MLPLPSINTTSPPPVLVSRPALAVDAVRPTSTVTATAKAVEPTAAISKQRAKVNSRADQQPAETGQQAQTERVAPTLAGVYSSKRMGAGLPGQVSGQGLDSPPSEKTPVQKALDVQIKNLLSKVWDASGKAVDFLLGREDSLLERTLKKVQLPADAKEVPRQQASGSSKQPPSSGAKPAPASVDAYTASGTASAADARGQLLDMVA